ncbi:MAG TPA: flavin reductase family protein [Bryobacteraceae bacterium]|nr:flavin reductase family protein [Bryobacteraceae bacterium]
MNEPFDPARFRRACARFATGITVSTALAADGTPHGFTANSFTSVSMEPPMVLICVDHRANVLRHFEHSSHFGVNILSASQEALSVRFAERGLDRFVGIDWQPGATGVPLLAGALARFECATRQTIAAGDHTIILGEVLHADWEEGDPLLYYASAYFLAQPRPRDSEI